MNPSVTEHAASGSAITPRTQASADNIFDNVGRALAVGIPRRQLIGLVFKGLAAAALAQIGVRSAWAEATCICAGTGQLYDPVLACCTSAGVQQKNPITNLAACPNKVPQPGFVPVPNGCGGAGSWLASLVPNKFGAASFLPCCNPHDVCYSTCNSVKATCDTNLGTCANSQCDAAYPPNTGVLNAIKNSSCHAVANRYEPAVRNYGQTFYDAGQMESCACCATSNCPSACAGPGTCTSFRSCGPGGDCVCATLTEGGGTCGHGSTPCAGIQRCTSTSQCPSGSTCWQTSCCGSFGVCVPVCNPLAPAPQGAQLQRIQSLNTGPTVAHP